MEFLYTKRNTDGKIEAVRLSASSRAEVFSVLKDKGVVPISVKQVESPTPNLLHSQTLKKSVTGLFAICILAGVGIGVWYLISRTDMPSTSQDPVRTQIEKPKHQSDRAEAKVSPYTAPVATQAVEKVHTKPKTAKEVLADYLANPPSVTNYMVGITVTTNRPKALFRNATEQMLSSLFRTELGSVPPPMPKVPMRDKVNIQDILSTQFSLSPETPEKEAAIKDIVCQAKRAMKEYLDQGGTPESFIDHYRNELQTCHETWKMCQQTAIKSCREEDPEVAREMVERINESLAAKGIKPVNLPPKFREKLGIK